LKHKRKIIDAEIAELRAILTGNSETVADQAPPKRKGRTLSAAVKRMSEAQKLRWAKIRDESKAAPEASVTKTARTARPKPHFSVAARKALSDDMKKRWAAQKAANGQSAPAAKKAARKKAA
jgi:hypothetical protein